MVVKHNLELDVRSPVVLDTGLVFVQNDCKANVLQITMLGLSDWAGVTAVMKYKRSDGLTVVDSIQIENGVLNHVVPMAALNVSGALFCEVALFKEDVRITSNQVRFLVREEIGEDSSFIADPRYPILDALIKETKAVNGVAKEEADRAKDEADRAKDEADRAAFIWKGEYSPSTTYSVSNAVSYNGSSFVALKTITGAAPTNDGVNWLIIARKGEPGPKGDKGEQGGFGEWTTLAEITISEEANSVLLLDHLVPCTEFIISSRIENPKENPNTESKMLLYAANWKTVANTPAGILPDQECRNVTRLWIKPFAFSLSVYGIQDGYGLAAPTPVVHQGVSTIDNLIAYGLASYFGAGSYFKVEGR